MRQSASEAKISPNKANAANLSTIPIRSVKGHALSYQLSQYHPKRSLSGGDMDEFDATIESESK